MLDPDSLPELREAILDEKTVRNLFDDLGRLAQVLEVRVKGQASTRGTSTRPSLDEARMALAAGASVQIRYAHGGGVWCDTLMPVNGGTRTVRIQMPK